MPLAAPISSMLSGRLDKASIDSDTKLSMACVWPEIKGEHDSHKGKESEKERESKSKGDITGPEKEKQNEHKQDWEINGKDREIFDSCSQYTKYFILKSSFNAVQE